MKALISYSTSHSDRGVGYFYCEEITVSYKSHHLTRFICKSTNDLKSSVQRAISSQLPIKVIDLTPNEFTIEVTCENFDSPRLYDVWGDDIDKVIVSIVNHYYQWYSDDNNDNNFNQVIKAKLIWESLPDQIKRVTK